MAMKEWFRKLQPVQLYVILTLTVLFFITELVMSHVTHALTLLMDSYHMLCNIIALAGCLITIKYGKNTDAPHVAKETATMMGEEPTDFESTCPNNKTAPLTSRGMQQEHKLKNTFGWARLDIIFMLICCVFLASLCFSILVEAFQTLAHIDHHDEMHHPLPVICIGAAGLLLNGICYLFIGGYTFHQGSFLYVTASGDVVVNRPVTDDSIRMGERRLSRTKSVPPPQTRQRQDILEMTRDTIGCIFVIVCALFVYFTEKEVAKYIDPILSIISAVLLMVLSYPYMKESCLILLQTIPDTINIDSLRSQLLEHFPDIVNVHDIHVWQLTANKVISTVHIIFQNPKVYAKITDQIKDFFLEQGITQVTIQPEFFTKTNSTESLNAGNAPSLCLMQCQSEGCKTSHCCPNSIPKSLTLNSKWKSKEVINVDDTTVDLKSIKIDNRELPIVSFVTAAASKTALEVQETATVECNVKEVCDELGHAQNENESAINNVS